MNMQLIITYEIQKLKVHEKMDLILQVMEKVSCVRVIWK